MNLADRIRAEGDTATLHELAWEVERLQEERDHWLSAYQASFDLNAELINGLDRARAQAWDLGWRAREYGHPQTANPYRSDA